jgi:hypothetical protein
VTKVKGSGAKTEKPELKVAPETAQTPPAAEVKPEAPMSMPPSDPELAAKRAKSLTDYERRLRDVEKLKEMTDTEAWQDFYRSIQQSIDAHGAAVLDAEKSREVIRHQEGVKILRGLIESVQECIAELNRFVTACPLFVQDMPLRATWNETLGTVELKRVF